MTPKSYIPLTDNPVPAINKDQLDKFTNISIHAAEVQTLDSAELAARVKDSEDELILGADLGGDKAVVRLFKIKYGTLNTVPGYEVKVQGDDGEGYLKLLEEASVFAESASIPLGISWGGPMDGSKPLYHPKAKTFISELSDKYDGDLLKISPAISAAINDGPAGALSGALQAYQQFGASDSLFIINGGGIGTSVVKDNVLYAAEAGHVEGIEPLNVYKQSVPCGVYDNSYICLERMGANKAGIEAQWEMLTGNYMRAKDIEDRYKEGNLLAGELYDNSAWILAHVISGTATAMAMDLQDKNVVVVGHGGAFKFPGYGERIKQIVDNHLGGEMQFIMTIDFGAEDSNACLDGAAIAALCG